MATEPILSIPTIVIMRILLRETHYISCMLIYVRDFKVYPYIESITLVIVAAKKILVPS